MHLKPMLADEMGLGKTAQIVATGVGPDAAKITTRTLESKNRDGARQKTAQIVRAGVRPSAPKSQLHS